LPRFNLRFRRPAEKEGPAYRQPSPGFDPDACFSFKYRRTVSNDNLVRLDGHIIPIPPGQPARSYAGRRVEVQERLYGSLVVCYQGRCIAKEAPALAGPLRARARRLGQQEEKGQPWPATRPVTAPKEKGQARRPAADHPWRKVRVTKSQST